MLTAILIALTIILWCAIVVMYFRTELIQWLDNRYGPDHRTEKKPRQKKPFWRLYD